MFVVLQRHIVVGKEDGHGEEMTMGLYGGESRSGVVVVVWKQLCLLYFYGRRSINKHSAVTARAYQEPSKFFLNDR